MEFRNSQLPRRRRLSIRALLADAKQYVREHKKAVTIVVIAVLAFYWWEIRPIRINNSCAERSGADARALLVNKAKVATDPERKQSYENLVQQNMYLRSDYESYYQRCLRSHGINL